MTGFHQTSTRQRQSQAYEGMRAFASTLALLGTLINSAPQTEQVSTVTVSGATNDKTYTLVINDISVSYTADGSATIAEIAAGLAAAIEAEGQVRRWVTASATATTVVVTALEAGRSFTITEDDAQLSIATTTAAAAASAVKAGRACTAEGEDPSTRPDTDSTLGHITAAGLMTAYDATWTGASLASGDTVYASISYEGQQFFVTQAFDTNNDTTIASLATAINAALDSAFGAGASVLAAAASGVLTLTAEIAGQVFEANVYATGSGGGTITAGGERPQLNESFWRGFGVSVRGYDQEVDADGNFAYPGNAGIRVMRRGHIWVRHNGTSQPAAGDPVYIYVGATTADQGKFYASSGTDRVLVPASIATWTGRGDRDSAASLALLELHAPSA